jgi:FKBP-type peptidyl-prolyl cis-trans isomerase FkpA
MFRRPSLLVLSGALVLAGCSKHVAEPGESNFTPAPPAPPDPGPAALEIVDDVVGSGKDAKSGDTVRVHYTGTLMNGTVFDSSRDHGTPFDFTLGAGSVIKGWDQGVVGMKVGGKRRLVIPQALGYGEAGSPPKIPSKAGLKFDIELLEVNPTTPSPAKPSANPEMGFDPSAVQEGMEQEPDPEEESP